MKGISVALTISTYWLANALKKEFGSTNVIWVSSLEG
jgi:hypothetical protein